MNEVYVNNKVVLREASLAERPLVAEVTRRSYAEYAKDSNPQFWTGYEASTRNTLLKQDDAERLVAEIDGQIVATVLFCPPYQLTLGEKLVTNAYPEMRLLSVLPEFRNMRLAGLLIDECERRALAAGFDTVTLHTTILMQTAKAMYERRGYVRYPQIDFEPVPGFIVWGYKKQFV